MAHVPTLGASAILDDRPTIQDALDFVPYRDTLVDILCDPATRTPLTIGLYGSWGSGKTSLMNMIKVEIEKAGMSAYYTTWFNAWKYNRDETLWRALLLHVLDAIRPSGPDDSPLSVEDLTEDQRKLANDLDRLEESLYRTVEWEQLGRWTLDWAKALRGTTEGAAEIALSFVPGGMALVNLLKTAAKAISGEDHQSIAEAFRREVTTRRREQLRSLEQFEREFQSLLDRHVLRPGGRLIVFVDDLDRCLPEKTIEVLEAIKLFLDVSGSVFVLGLDQDATVEAIQTRYADRVKAHEYLEKIIQIPFLLPPIEGVRMRGFVEVLAPHLPDSRCSDVFAEGLPHNPRQVKRTINIFLLLWKLSRQGLQELIQPVRLAKVVVIQQAYPSLSVMLREMPGLLRDLETFFRTETERLGEHNIRKLETTAHLPYATSSLPPQLQPFVGQSNLRHLLTMHSTDEPDANFIDLTPQDIRAYIYLTHRSAQQPGTPDIPAVVLEPQVIAIPAGRFQMGSNDATAYSEETPLHELYLPDYAIGRYPTTNFEYRAFIQDTGHTPPTNWENDNYPTEIGDHPVVCVQWSDARTYCNWLSQKTGKNYRLPTEAEWEKAARGTNGLIWPWGNEWDSHKCNSKESGLGGTTPVGQYSTFGGDSPYAVADMAGNVWEWCSSHYRPYPYRQDDGREDLAISGDRVLRGGAFSDQSRLVRSTYRYGRHPRSSDRSISFRVVVHPSDTSS